VGPWGQSSQQKTCNISERGKVGPRLLLMTNRKSHAHFRLLPKSTTLGDPEGTSTLLQNTCVIGSPPRKFECRQTRRSCSQMILNSDDMFYADICGGSLQAMERELQTTGIIENVDFRSFGRYVLSTIGNEAIII